MLCVFSQKYATCKFVWYSVVHTPVERLDLFFVANSIDDESKKRAILLSSSGADTYKLFKGLSAPAKPAEISYPELTQLMQNHVRPKPNTIMERFKFNTRDRQPSENISTYIAELRRLTEHCEYTPTILDDMIRDRLVCGIKNTFSTLLSSHFLMHLFR